ncbi:MAG: gamma carbonic anhydrase family protein [Gammaproteobacteria bacterium]|nr:gamma carbonic anhydrase family protein [Gammaproteobacteria bacterium]
MQNIRTFDNFQPSIASNAYIDEAAIVIGDVTIGAQSSIWPGVIVRGDIHRISIGEETNIQDGSILHVTHDSKFLPGGAELIIGNGVTVGHRVILHGCTIQDAALIGMGAIIMDQARVRSHVVVGAGSVVPGHKDLESGYLYFGAPARRVRKLTQQELDYFDYSARHYVKLTKRHHKNSE